MSVFRQTPDRHDFTVTCRYCAAHALHGSDACAAHQGEAGRLIAQPYRAGYRDPEYGKNRSLALKRAKGLCESCGDPLPWSKDGKRRIFQCHHIDGNPTNNSLSNLLVCCEAKCHRGARRPE